jgi:hypothetical protein
MNFKDRKDFFFDSRILDLGSSQFADVECQSLVGLFDDRAESFVGSVSFNIEGKIGVRIT